MVLSVSLGGYSGWRYRTEGPKIGDGIKEVQGPNGQDEGRASQKFSQAKSYASFETEKTVRIAHQSYHLSHFQCYCLWFSQISFFLNINRWFT